MYFTKFFVKLYDLVSMCTCGSVKIWVFFDHILQYFKIKQSYEPIETIQGVKWEIKKWACSKIRLLFPHLHKTLANCDYFSELGRGSQFITRLSFTDKKDASLHRIKVIVWFVFIPLQPRLPPPTCDPRGEIESNWICLSCGVNGI